MTSPRFAFVGTLAPLALVLAVTLAPVETVIGAGLGAWLLAVRNLVLPARKGWL